MSIFQTLSDNSLSFVRVWWRPIGYTTLIGAMIANTILIPYLTQKGVNLRDLSVLILAFAPLAGLRTYEKLKDPNDPLGQDSSDHPDRD